VTMRALVLLLALLVQLPWILSVVAYTLVVPALAHGGSAVQIGVEGPTTPLDRVVADNFATAAKDYMDRYPDVKAVYNNNIDAAYQHYLMYGKNEGRTWNQGQTKVIFGYCGDHGVGGTGNGSNCIRFPNGAKIGAINWQSAVKVGHSDILFALSTSTGLSLLNTFHHGESNITRPVMFPEPIEIPPGGYVWIWADGWGDASPGGVEVQTGLYLYGNPAAVTEK